MHDERREFRARRKLAQFFSWATRKNKRRPFHAHLVAVDDVLHFKLEQTKTVLMPAFLLRKSQAISHHHHYFAILVSEPRKLRPKWSPFKWVSLLFKIAIFRTINTCRSKGKKLRHSVFVVLVSLSRGVQMANIASKFARNMLKLSRPIYF